MEKETARKSLVRHLLVLVGNVALTAILMTFLFAFRSVHEVYFEATTLFTVGVIVFILLSANYLIIFSFGKGDPKTIILVDIVLLLTIVAALLCIYFGQVYVMPVAFLALILGTDLDKHVALSAHFTCISVIGIFMAMFFYQSADFNFSSMMLQLMTLMVNIGMGTLLISLIKPYSSRLRVLVVAGITVLSFGVVAFVSSAATGAKPDVMNMITVGISVILGGAVSLFAYFCLSPLFERVFNLNTGLRLMELCSFDQPLLKELEEKAPGTFNHSLTVANISERAAYVIGENPVLAKAAALFHDIGKMENPEFFTENQTDGYNPHDDLIPEASVKMITRHTEAGAKLLDENGFPKEIISAALQHHGDSPVGYFYNKAQNITEGTLGEKGYTYVGPKPQTKINAIIMVADISEAATRSVRPSTREELVALVDKLVQKKMEERQFDECPITIAELTKVKEAVVNTLMGVHHERISYSIDRRK